jgi:peptide methionine sulfoxide reductase MsrB
MRKMSFMLENSKKTYEQQIGYPSFLSPMSNQSRKDASLVLPLP